MRQISGLRFVAALLVLLGPPCTGQAATIDFGSGDFAGWTTTTFLGAANGQSVSLDATGGNPDANLRVTTTTNAATFTGHFDPAAVYDPAQGAIVSISASLDYRIVSAFNQGQGAAVVLLEQGGSYFQAGGFLTGSVVDGTWRTTILTAASQNDFSLLAGNGGLDFSNTGAPIRLGFWTGNEGGLGIAVRYDNWNATVTPVPAPSALILAVTAFVSFLGWRRR